MVENINIDALIQLLYQQYKSLPLKSSITSAPISSSATTMTPYQYLSGRGFVLNIVSQRGLSSAILHILLQSGEVYIGDYLQAGGWIGQVQRIALDTMTTTNTAATTDQYSTDPKVRITAGMSAKLIVQYSHIHPSSSKPTSPVMNEIADGSNHISVHRQSPTPLNELVHFFSLSKASHIDDHINMMNQNNNSNNKKMTKAGHLEALKEEVIFAQDEYIMREGFGK
jgi:hypothetical protein